ncbi:MAG: DUF503 domain-containing protein [Phycisphaerae bacterium]|jgi:hypothetical protein
MIVGVLTIDLAIFDAQSLKDKRRVVSSLKEKLGNRFNVSVAELESHDNPKQSQLGIALISKDSRPVHARMDKIVDFVRAFRGLSLVDYRRELL